MRCWNKKSLTLIVAAALLLTITVGGTTAYFLDTTDEAVYTFQPGFLATGLQSADSTAIRVENQGTVDAYIRVAIVGNWVDENNVILAPWMGDVSINEADGWQQGEDGFYYYTARLAARENALTPNLLAAPIASGEGPDGAALKLQVLHQSIQADGRSKSGAFAAEEAWHVTITENWVNGALVYALEP